MEETNYIIKKINIFLIIFLMSIILYFFYGMKNNTQIFLSNNYEIANEEFINLISSSAIKDMKETGIYASVTIGQAIIESGWGGSNFAIKYNNYFGMKAGAKVQVNGKITTCTKNISGQIGQATTSNQFWSGQAVCVKASEGTYSWFRVYDSIENSIKDHSRNFWCISDGRYIKNGVFQAKDPETQLYVIASSGYAVNVSGQVTTIGQLRYDQYIYQNFIKKYNLTQYDSGYKIVKPSYANSCSNATYEGTMPTVPSDNNGNSFTNYTTNYSGDVTKGYIYERQTGKGLKETTADKIDDRINSIISSIFGSSNYNTTSGSGGDVSIGSFDSNALNWKQYDSAWGSIHLGSSKHTIKSAGCLATSVAIQIKISGTTLNVNNFNPGLFVGEISKNNGFTSGGLFIWNGSWKTMAPNWNYYGKDSLPATKSGKIDYIRNLLNQGYYPVMCVKRDCGHWVAVTGVSEDNIIIADPGSNSTSVWPRYNAISNDSTLKVAYFKG